MWGTVSQSITTMISVNTPPWNEGKKHLLPYTMLVGVGSIEYNNRDPETGHVANMLGV